MRNLIIWIIIAALATQVTVNTIDLSDQSIEPNFVDDQESLQTSARDSHQMAGSDDGDNPNCNFTNMANGLGGPVWTNGTDANVGDIYEYPANSGHFWQSTTSGPTAQPESSGKWIGPCSCEEIAEESEIHWNANTAYDPWQILEYNAGIWIVQDAGTTAGDVPEEGTDIWVLCATSCFSIVNVSTMVWETSSLVTEGEIYEYPANSGHYYTVVGVGIYNQTVGEPGQDLDAWGEPLDCSCRDIWVDSGEPLWDSTVEYLQNAVVEWPAGSNNLYISYDHGTGIEPGSANGSYLWRNCNGEEPSGSLCADFDGNGGIPWDAMIAVSEGQIFEYPAGSGEFYQVSVGINNQIVGAPGVDGDAWSEKHCTCKDIWMEASSPAWDSNTVYNVGAIVEYPTGSNALWMAVVNQTTTGVTPDQPFADGNQWELCGPEDNTTTGPCGGMDSVGPWYSNARVSTGEIYEYPAGSQTYYEVVIQGYVDQEVLSPTVDLDVWAEVDCPCEEIWMNAGEPVWDNSTVYYLNDVVEWPPGSNQLWIALDSQFSGAEPSSADLSWESCGDSDTPSGGPCAGLNVVGVWSSGTNVTSGDVYEYPAGSHTYYVVNPGSPFWSVSAPDIDMDVWSPIVCPCKDTWVANGQPVWDISVMYWLDEVVEWPAGSDTLWIAIDNTSNAEPSLTSDSWKHCPGTNMPYSNPCAGLDVIGVWTSSTVVASGEIYEYPLGSQNYYQVNQGGPFTNVNAPDVDMDVWSPIDCPCKETWAANGQPVWVAGTAYPGDYVVEHPAGSGNLYIPLESGGVTTGAGEPGVDIHWVLCNGNGPSPGPCEGLDVPVWDNTTTPVVGDIYEYPANSGIYHEIIFIHDDLYGGNDWVADPIMDGGADEFWKPYSCPCKETWVANGEPVWDNTSTFYPGNYVVEWPAGSGALYISEGGGLTGVIEPGTDDGHWIPCDGNPEAEAEPEEDDDDDDSIPSIGFVFTVLGVLLASTFVRRTMDEE